MTDKKKAGFLHTLRNRLKECLAYEKEIYSDYMFPTKRRYIISRIRYESPRRILQYLQYSRKTDYYSAARSYTKSPLVRAMYFYYITKKNKLGEQLGFEMTTKNIGKGLLMYHYNVVINGSSIIGENCHLHGDNCIGNSGLVNECPVIGDNVSLGVGAKVIGNVKIANNIKIGAGAVVVHSFFEEGITIGGIPAKRIK